MNRLGWIILALIALLGTSFALLATKGGYRATAVPDAPPPVAVMAAPSGLVVPVSGIRPEALSDSWHDAREGGARVHEAIDIMAPGGTPVLAAQSGRVEKLFQSRLGGTTAYVRSDDGQWISYYAHLAGYAAGLSEGLHVARGQTIAFVGDTGDAGPGNTHLHFALQRMAPGERWWQGTPVNPYPLLAGKPSAR